ncbi:hypothetical protein HD554DRAFT_2175079 [Boletus coccyginus]|nr:hypothetical protein HD554DRAFT_2175079 [Boletus coccyginus]
MAKKSSQGNVVLHFANPVSDTLSIRRDKIRCDGAKPCGACVKKGYTIDQCIDGCESCRKARVRCEGGKPCQRCRELDQECVEEQVTTAMRSDVVPPVFVLRNRQKNERAKLACQNCRRDNKKQGIEGECPHRPGQEADTSDGNGSGHHNGQPKATSDVQDPYLPHNPPLPMPPHGSQIGMAPAMFPSLVYGPSPYQMLATQHPIRGPGEGSSTGYPRVPYYPVIDPQIDLPQTNISSERYDPSSTQTGATKPLYEYRGHFG